MKAIILFSGGLDSTTLLGIALKEKRECIAITFNYGQRHQIEIESAKAITKYYNIPHKIITIDPTVFGHSTLTNHEFDVPKNQSTEKIIFGSIPNTYVPARNTLFLAYAIGQAELFKADEIYFGPNALDHRPYPDCRPEFVSAFKNLIPFATKQSIINEHPKLITPLLFLDKKEIIEKGKELSIPFELTWSCYDPQEKKQCGKCAACILKQEGFKEARVSDPTQYAQIHQSA